MNTELIIERGRQFGVTGPQAREGQGMLAAMGRWKRLMDSPPEAQENAAPLELRENVFLLFEVTGPWYLLQDRTLANC